jgi:hypothetical protein
LTFSKMYATMDLGEVNNLFAPYTPNKLPYEVY